MDYKEFSSTIKAKYPDYAEIDDKKLAEAMIAKYPEYKDKVTFGNPVGDLLKKVGGAIMDNPVGNAVEKGVDFVGNRLSENLGEAGYQYKKFSKEASDFASKAMETPLFAPMIANAPESEAQARVGNEAFQNEYKQSFVGDVDRKLHLASEAAVSGITGGIVRPSTETSKSVADKVVQGIGNIMGAATAITKISDVFGALAAGNATIAEIMGQYPTVAKYAFPLIKNMAGFDAYGQLDPNVQNRFAQLAKDSMMSIPYTGLGFIPRAAYSIPASVGLGYGLAKMDGASDEDAFIQGGILGVMDAMGRAGGKGEQFVKGRYSDKVIRNEAIEALNQYSSTKITAKSTPEEIKAAYREAAMATHPDRGGNQADFVKIQQAYDFLNPKTEGGNLQQKPTDQPIGDQQKLPTAQALDPEAMKISVMKDMEAGKSPTQIKYELSQKIGVDNATALVDEVTAGKQVAKQEVAQVQPTEQVSAEVKPIEVQAPAEEATGKLQKIDETILQKTPADVQAEFTKLTENHSAKVDELSKKVDELKTEIETSPNGSAEKMQLKKQLTTAKEAVASAESGFTKEMTDHAQGMRDFLTSYIPTAHKDIKFSPSQLDDVIDDVMVQMTHPEALRKTFATSVKDIVDTQVAKFKGVQESGGIKIGDTVQIHTKEGEMKQSGEVKAIRPEGIIISEKNTGTAMMFRNEKYDFAKIEPKKTQKEQVKEVLKNKESASVKDIAAETKILEPNVRRILGVGEKEGTFTRIEKGVYTIAKDGQDIAYIHTGDAVETLPKLAEEGFKADMVFLDIPYDTPAVKGGNRGVKYELLSVDQFKTIVAAVKKIARTEDTPVLYMYSQATSGLAAMQKYTDVILGAGFQPIARGGYTKLQKDGITTVSNMLGQKMKPEGILLLTQSGNFNKETPDLNFKFVRPKGYQTEKPAELMKQLIEMTTDEGDVVLDPFAGSGVTPEQAVKTGRKAVAIEKSKKAVEEHIKPRVEKAAAERIEQVPSSNEPEKVIEYYVKTHQYVSEGGFDLFVKSNFTDEEWKPLMDAFNDSPAAKQGLVDKANPYRIKNPEAVPADKTFYHGTLENFNDFSMDHAGKNTEWDNAKFGIFFTDDKNHAETFVDTSRPRGDERPAIVKEVHLDLKNPIDLTLQGILNKEDQAATVVKILQGEDMSNKEALELLDETIDLGTVGDLYEGLYSDIENKKILQDAGYDGIISEFGRDDNNKVIKEYVVFDASQIKQIDKGGNEGDNKGNGKPKQTDNGGGNTPDTREVSEPVSDSKNKPARAGKAATRTRSGERGGQQHDVNGDKLGERSGTRLTNEEVEQRVSSATEISDKGEVLIKGKITDELLEAANQYQPGGLTKEGRGILDEYYTPSQVVDMVQSLLDLPTGNLNILEPAVGTGNFLHALPETGQHNITAHEINPVTARIAKIFHPDAKVLTTSFEENFVDERGNAKKFSQDYDLVIGNPPYGEHRGKYLGLGEEKGISKYED